MARIDKRKVQREIELKFDIRGRQLKRLRRRVVLRDLSVSKPFVRKLTSIYFDDTPQSLRNAGVSLRLRKSTDGWVQTLKWNKISCSGLFDAREFETAVPNKKLDVALLMNRAVPAEISKLLSGRRLTPIFKTQISRTTRLVRSAGGHDIEVAFDSGQVSNGELTELFEELELELKSGDVSGLFKFARQLIGKEFVLLSRYSKAERGYALISGDKFVRSAGKTQKSKFLPRESIDLTGSVIQKTFSVCAEQIIHNLALVLTSADPEGPHQLRIGLRRLRSAIQSVEPVFESDGRAKEFKRIAREARKLGRLVGALRDADVLESDIAGAAIECASSASIEIGANQLSKALAQHRVDTRKSVVHQLSSNQTTRFLLDLLERIALLSQIENSAHPSKTIEDRANEALQKSWNKVSKRGRRLSKLSIKERHNMRKDLKTLRYQAEFFAGLYPESRVKPFLKALKRLQNVFGYLNDAAMAEQLLILPSLKSHPNPLVQKGIGYVVGWHENRAAIKWVGAQGQWKDLCSIKPFWQNA